MSINFPSKIKLKKSYVIHIDLSLSSTDEEDEPLIPSKRNNIFNDKIRKNTILNEVKNASNIIANAKRKRKRTIATSLQSNTQISHQPSIKKRKLNSIIGMKIPKFKTTHRVPDILTLCVITETGDRKLKTIGKNEKFEILMKKFRNKYTEFEFILDDRSIDPNSTPNNHCITNYGTIYLKEIKTCTVGSDIIYKSNDTILFLGEMDFSLSNCVTKLIGGKNIISTSYWKSVTGVPKCQFQASQNIKSLQRNGATVLHNIDATTLNKYQFKCANQNVKLLDKIIFAFPYSTQAKQDEKHLENQKFIKSVFESCRNILKPNGELHLLLNINDNQSQIKTWNIQYIDWSCVKQHKMDKVELNRIFSGYIVRDTKGYRWDLKLCAMYVFKQNKLFLSL